MCRLHQAGREGGRPAVLHMDPTLWPLLLALFLCDLQTYQSAKAARGLYDRADLVHSLYTRVSGGLAYIHLKYLRPWLLLWLCLLDHRP